MKKYLILFTLILSSLLYSCSDYDYYTDEYKNNGIAYEQLFTQYIGGTIDSSQTWGFDDKEITTRSTYPNSNMWEDEGYIIPAAITQDEINKVKKVFAEKMPEGYVCTPLVDWNEFFVQHVYTGDSVYVDGFGQNVIAHNHMDWLCAYSSEMQNNDDHIYNFNATFGSIQLMYNSSTRRFGLHCSTDSKIHYNFRMEEIDGAYYVGFDFEATGQNPNQQVARDWVFDDWIIKICPGKGDTDKTRRIIVEDLVASSNLTHLNESDWDYNDAVFDAIIENGIATITLRAAMGTLPLYVAGKEVHEMFGVPTKQIVDTRNGDIKPVTYRVAINVTDINLIPVIVTNGGQSYELLANKGQAPAKICVGRDYDWCDERQHIKLKYPKFVEWSTKNPPEWGKDGWYK